MTMRFLSVLSAAFLLTQCSTPDVLSETEMRPQPGKKREAYATRSYEVVRVETRHHSPSICREDSSILLRDDAGKELLFCYDAHNFRSEGIVPGMRATACLDGQGAVIYLSFITGQSS